MSLEIKTRRRDDDEDDDKEVPPPPLYLTEVFGALCGKSQFSDCTFVVGKGKERIPIHRLILAASSPVFATMLFPATETRLPEPFDISLSSVDPTSFRGLLQAIYTEEVKADASTLPGIISLAKRYQVEKVQALCSDVLEADVNVDNACQLFELAPTMLEDKEFGLPFIRENTEAVMDTEGFLRLSKERVIALIRDDELSIEEFPLYKAVIRWCKNQISNDGKPDTPDNLKEVMTPFLPHIRFPAMQLDEIAGYIAPSGVLPSEQLLDVFKFISLTDHREKEAAAIRLGFNIRPRAGASLSWKESKILAKVTADRKMAQAMIKIMGIRPGQKPKTNLLYRGSRDGFNASSFHTRCDGKGPTLTIVKAQGRKHIFGAYNPDAWNSNGAYGTNTQTYLFSLVNNQDKPVRIEATGGSMAYNASGYGPTFGSGHDFHINNNMKSNSNYTRNTDFTRVAGDNSVTLSIELLPGGSNFTVEEIEVFGLENYRR